MVHQRPQAWPGRYVVGTLSLENCCNLRVSTYSCQSQPQPASLSNTFRVAYTGEHATWVRSHGNSEHTWAHLKYWGCLIPVLKAVCGTMTVYTRINRTDKISPALPKGREGEFVAVDLERSLIEFEVHALVAHHLDS